MVTDALSNALKASLVLLLLIAALCGYYVWRDVATDKSKASIALLIEDGVSKSDPAVTIWKDAANEEGILLDVIYASDFLRPATPWERRPYQGLILPDQVAKKVSATLTVGLTQFVENGGKLFLTFDAATRNVQGKYHATRAPMSHLVGIDYAMYDSLAGRTIDDGNAMGTDEDMERLGLPPGKYMPTTITVPTLQLDTLNVITGYQYGPLKYSSFVTQGNYLGRRLLSNANGDLLAGFRQWEKGGVLFVNMPLGYLKGRTDGILLHGFLRYFATGILGVPSLSAAPNGRGGLIFNWHVDSNAAILPIEKMQKMGVLSQGPFSIHFTAGPDAREAGDGLGLNLRHNKVMQSWVALFKQRGDALGNHGGWIHDYFGFNVGDDNQATFQIFLEKNSQLLTEVNHAPVREYSAPLGTQPEWVTTWLEAHGFTAYYFMGNNGMPATRSYRDGVLASKRIWSFPVLTFGDVASFEDATEKRMSGSTIVKWLRDFSDFVVRNGTVRMFYAHPPGVLQYPQSVKKWFLHTKELLAQGGFQWYTMTQMADFLNMRERTVWHIESVGDDEHLLADHPDNLDTLTWRFPKSKYDAPQLIDGQGIVVERNTEWYFIAGKGQHIALLLIKK